MSAPLKVILGKSSTVEFDYEEIPFVYGETASTRPSPQELAVIAAALQSLFPERKRRAWDIAARIFSLETGLS